MEYVNYLNIIDFSLEQEYKAALEDCKKIIEDNIGILTKKSMTTVSFNGREPNNCGDFTLFDSLELFKQAPLLQVCTNKLPYDKVVMACLIAIKWHLKSGCSIYASTHFRNKSVLEGYKTYLNTFPEREITDHAEFFKQSGTFILKADVQPPLHPLIAKVSNILTDVFADIPHRVCKQPEQIIPLQNKIEKQNHSVWALFALLKDNQDALYSLLSDLQTRKNEGININEVIEMLEQKILNNISLAGLLLHTASKDHNVNGKKVIPSNETDTESYTV